MKPVLAIVLVVALWLLLARACSIGT